MRIAYANVFVSDLARAVAFYRDQLGLELQHRDSAHGYASFAVGAVSLGLAAPPPDGQALVGRHTGIGFAVSDLLAEHARLSALGVRFPSPPERQPWGGFMATLEDPDGNLFYLDQIDAAHA